MIIDDERGHGQISYTGALDHASRTPQLISCNYSVCSVCVCVLEREGGREGGREGKCICGVQVAMLQGAVTLHSCAL